MEKAVNQSNLNFENNQKSFLFLTASGGRSTGYAIDPAVINCLVIKIGE